MTERFKAVVRRRREDDDDRTPVEERWPADLRWIAEWDRFDCDSGAFVSGCTSPHGTYAEALADAISEADEVRRRNAEELSETVG